MSIQLPLVVQSYVDASNDHHVKSVVSCFASNAMVRDEKMEYRDKKNIEAWIESTLDKYKFHFKPLSVENRNDTEVVVAMEVSGTFDGSPVRLHFLFEISNDLISSLIIEP